MGPRGDAIVEADWSVGEILNTLDRLNLTRNTLVIVTSDNGPVVDDGYKDDAVAKLGSHKPAGALRGGKYSNFEGGTRVPFIVRWPNQMSAGVSDALICQIDLLASLATMTGTSLGPSDLSDSTDVLPALLGKSKTGRSELVEEAGALSLRQGNWKYIEPNNKQKINVNTNTELGNDSVPQLYDLSSDPGETRNVASSHADRVTSMAAALDRIRAIKRR
jgi:arylsulfatase A-like enzyme